MAFAESKSRITVGTKTIVANHQKKGVFISGRKGFINLTFNQGIKYNKKKELKNEENLNQFF